MVIQSDSDSSLSEFDPAAFSDDSDFEDIPTLRTTKRMRDRSASPLVTVKAKRASKIKKKDKWEELEEWHEELSIDWDGLKKQNGERLVKEAEQPKDIVDVILLPFQKEGLNLFIDQEESIFKGGILADEMGMGKTMQMISLICKNKVQNNLVVCPVVSLIQWKEEIEKFTPPGMFKVSIFHGPDRTKSDKELVESDIVLTSYAVVESCYRKEKSGFNRKHGKIFEDSILHKVNWGRIILDEAHNIKDRSCSRARSVFALNSKNKWILTGTPLQNRIGELYSLIRFLRVEPYSSYYCKKCPCKSMQWKFSDYKSCDDCGHGPMQHFCWWNNVILKPIQKFGPTGEGKTAYSRLSILLDQIMLRRTKLEREEDLGLPPRIVDVRRVWMSEQEEDFYEALYSETRTQFTKYVNAGTVLNNYAHIFELLSKLRQAADHPFLVVYKNASKTNPGGYVCGLCHEIAEDPIASKCKHVFCREDIKQYYESFVADDSLAQCPVCFSKLSLNLDQITLETPQFNANEKKNTSIVSRILHRASDIEGSIATSSPGEESVAEPISLPPWSTSTKIEALLESLNEIHCTSTPQKNILEWRLKTLNIQCVRLDGRMGKEKRDAVVKAFMNIPQIAVFLVSLKAGGVALNLTEASRVFLVDPWWNPAAEDQAMDRIHRLGQHRPVRITRIIIENSIESRIIELQVKKKLLFQSTIGKDQAALERLTEEDLQFLFQM